MPKGDEPSPGDANQPLMFQGLRCPWCAANRPHPGDVKKMPDPKPGSVWSIVLDDLPPS